MYSYSCMFSYYYLLLLVTYMTIITAVSMWCRSN